MDDGSTDGSGAILDEYAAKDARFRVFHKANGGVSSARNLALERVRGEWVTFLDGDDTYSPMWLAAFAMLSERVPQADLIRLRLAEGARGRLEVRGAVRGLRPHTITCAWRHK